jgi:hypothetical protein
MIVIGTQPQDGTERLRCFANGVYVCDAKYEDVARVMSRVLLARGASPGEDCVWRGHNRTIAAGTVASFAMCTTTSRQPWRLRIANRAWTRDAQFVDKILDTCFDDPENIWPARPPKQEETE